MIFQVLFCFESVLQMNLNVTVCWSKNALWSLFVVWQEFSVSSCFKPTRNSLFNRKCCVWFGCFWQRWVNIFDISYFNIRVCWSQVKKFSVKSRPISLISMPSVWYEMNKLLNKCKQLSWSLNFLFSVRGWGEVITCLSFGFDPIRNQTRGSNMFKADALSTQLL